MPNLQKVINLLKKTGDKAIILDQNGDPSYVIMTLADYEGLILGKSEVKGLTEPELLDKINHDIAIWQDSQKTEELPVDQYDFSRELEWSKFSNFSPNLDKKLAEEALETADEDRFYFEPVEA